MIKEEIATNAAHLDEIQATSLKIYGRYDLEKSMIWMVEEMGEVISAIRKGKSKEEITGEMGDLMAWLFCLGNILDIKVSDAVEGTFHKEVNRQLRLYSELKYYKTIEK
ncbi:MazG nucleotide pyrophosphohydrolase domain-containing protein [Paenibacillus andongensis]|uniref:MazG nucleotide pyrophosphohydrolase domain-containing protein n=1 Tax=Paenibacillus andongensis TaxID=2975482 RepID=UPI0021BB70D2|nr:MazG nucleotide pyrophosphohydrolase domain-containing protein [Paenibacillus andongensis]